MEQPTRLRRARYYALIVGSAIVVGIGYGLLVAALGSPDALFTWWGTTLRALVAVAICLPLAGFLERRWSTRG